MFDRSVEVLKNGYNVVYDATNLVVKTRKATLAAIRDKVECEANLVFVACSISECKRRQGMRERKVPDEVIDRMVRQFQAPWYNEGWNHLFVYDGGRLQNIDREHWRMLGESHDNPHHTASLGMHCANCEGKMSDLLKREEWTLMLTPRGKKMVLEAAYNHDLGKHKTKAFFDSKGNPSEVAHYYSHDNVGAYLWLSGDKRINWTNDEFFYIALLIQWHMQPYFLKEKGEESRAKFEDWCDKKGFDELFCETILLLHEADKAAH